MVNFECKSHYDIADLVEIVKILRAPGGCPWDREQTHESIRRNLLEEAYEVAEAIDEGSRPHLLEELGDVLLQVVFHSRIEEEQGSFDLSDVADGVCKKLIHRHPHVFGNVQADNSAQVLANWDQIKREEKNQKTTAEAMDSVARSLPGLWRAEKVQSKAAKAGFDLPDTAAALAGVEVCTAALGRQLAQQQDPAAAFGALLFFAAALGRRCGLDGETALARCCDDFIASFSAMEQAGTPDAQALYDPEKLKSERD